MDVTRIEEGDSHYPPQLGVCLGDGAPETLGYIGNIELLKSKSLALFCSKKCPGSLILQTYDLAQRLRERGTPVISGFHSPVERECLNILLRGQNPLIICPARGLEGMRPPNEYDKPMREGRLLLLSPFSEKIRRADGRLATIRNAVVAALAHEVFVAHAEPRSKTEILCRDIISWGKGLYTFENSANHDLIELGAQSLSHGQSQLAEVDAP